MLAFHARSFRDHQDKKCSDKTDTYLLFRLSAAVLLGFLHNDDMKLWLNGGTDPALITFIKNYWFHCFPRSACISFPVDTLSMNAQGVSVY